MTMSRKGWVPWPVARGARFYTGRMFPAAYRNNIFIAEHGSWNRSRKSGYRIVRVEVDQAGRALRQEVFADGWLQVWRPGERVGAARRRAGATGRLAADQ